MAKRILVPLDLTPAGDSVVPLVVDVARGGGAVVRLLHVARDPENVMDLEGRVIAYADQETSRIETQALYSLRQIEAQFYGLPVESVVHFGNPVDHIVAEAEDFQADLIALTTGHHNALRRFFLGSTAEQVSRETDTALLVLRPPTVSSTP